METRKIRKSDPISRVYQFQHVIAWPDIEVGDCTREEFFKSRIN